MRTFPRVSSLFCNSKSPGAAVPVALVPDDSGVKGCFCRVFRACVNLLKSLNFLAPLCWGGVQAGTALAESDPEASTPLTSKLCSICSVSSSKRNAVCVLWDAPQCHRSAVKWAPPEDYLEKCSFLTWNKPPFGISLRLLGRSSFYIWPTLSTPSVPQFGLFVLWTP